MAAASAPADPELVIEVQELRTSLQGLDTSVTSLILNVQQIKADMKDLHSSADGGVYGESYAIDSGPAVRAKFFEALSRQVEEMRTNLSRLHVGLEGQATRLSDVHDNVLANEVQQTTQRNTMSEQAVEVNTAIERLEGELQALRTEARDPGARVPAAARIPKNITGTKGFETLKVYSGDATQWPELRFRITTWLVQENLAFESLMVKL